MSFFFEIEKRRENASHFSFPSLPQAFFCLATKEAKMQKRPNHNLENYLRKRSECQAAQASLSTPGTLPLIPFVVLSQRFLLFLQGFDESPKVDFLRF